MASHPKATLSAAEYLELERKAAEKSEYFYGEIFAMSGGSLNHAAIGGNIYHALRRLLAGSPCQPFNSDLRIAADPAHHYAYPDVSIVCEEPKLADGYRDAITNPVAIFEVLSPTTAAHRGAKFRSYQRIPTLREYFLVSQHEALVERFERQADGKWLLSNHEGMDAVVPVASVPCELALGEIFDGVTFD